MNNTTILKSSISASLLKIFLLTRFMLPSDYASPFILIRSLFFWPPLLLRVLAVYLFVMMVRNTGTLISIIASSAAVIILILLMCCHGGGLSPLHRCTAIMISYLSLFVRLELSACIMHNSLFADSW